MGLLGGWWGVAAVGLVAIFLIREYFKYAHGEVYLTARQKVVRSLGGLLLLAITLLVVYSPQILCPRPGTSLVAQHFQAAIYWGICLGISVFLLMMAVMDAGEISREYVRLRKAARDGTLTPNDLQRIRKADRKDHPDDVGRKRDS